MEWKKIASMEYEKIIFHSIPFHSMPWLLVPILIWYERHNESYVELCKEHDSCEKCFFQYFGRKKKGGKTKLRMVETKFIKFQNNCYHLT